MSEPLAPLPIAINTLRKLRDNDCLYVDKTELAWQLAQRSAAWFLSRPRRFGKSLFLDTLKQLFLGSRELFANTWIEERWDWQQQWPVIHIDLAAGVVQSREELDLSLREILQDNQRQLGVSCTKTSIAGCFSDLIRLTGEKYGKRVVILIDEYDKPILDNIEDPERAAAVREGLKNFYSVMKAEDGRIHFIFMTGVTKFSKVSLFSGLNQLDDITLDPHFATICGYTQRDLETTFAGHLAGVDWSRLRQWYNGYSFLGERVYNPYDILLFISKGGLYRNYWFETGSPSFLIKLFRQKQQFLPVLEGVTVGEEILDSFDIESIDPVTLLFQSGYLTIDQALESFATLSFRLRIPNAEVRTALSGHLLDGYTGHLPSERMQWQQPLYEAMKQGDAEGLIAAIRRLFASIPWRNFTNNDLPEMEGWYASVLYAFFASLNAVIRPEDITNHGQVDLTVELAGHVWVMEIKLDRSATGVLSGENPALKQITERRYSEKYRDRPGQGLVELGLVFGGPERNLVQADWRRLV